MRESISPSGSFRAISYASLPARLHQAGDHSLGPELAQRNAAHLELAVEGARPAGHGAAVADPRPGRVARQLGELQRGRETILHRQLLVARDRLEPAPPAGKLLGKPAPSFVLLDRTLLR